MQISAQECLPGVCPGPDRRVPTSVSRTEPSATVVLVGDPTQSGPGSERHQKAWAAAGGQCALALSAWGVWTRRRCPSACPWTNTSQGPRAGTVRSLPRAGAPRTSSGPPTLPSPCPAPLSAKVTPGARGRGAPSLALASGQEPLQPSLPGSPGFRNTGPGAGGGWGCRAPRSRVPHAGGAAFALGGHPCVHAT